MKKLVVLSLSIFYIQNLYAQSIIPAHLKTPKNCFIQVTTLYKLGETKVSTHSFFYSAKNKCEKMNRILSENFSPSEVKNVETKMEWSGK